MSNQNKIKICSAASILVGGLPIQTFDEGTVESLTADSMYDDCYEDLLRYRPWTFAREYHTPVKVNKVSKAGYKHVYLIPNTVITVMDIGVNAPFKLVGKNELHTDVENPRVRVVVKPQETDLPADFLLALKYKLAKDFAIVIREEVTRSQWCEDQLNKALLAAAANDLEQEPAEDLDYYDPLFDSHYHTFTG